MIDSEQNNPESIAINLVNADTQFSISEVPESILNNTSNSGTKCNLTCCRIDNLDFPVRLPFSRKETLHIYGSGSNIRERYFNVKWLETFPWLYLCKTTKKALCSTCMFAVTKNLVCSLWKKDAFFKDGMNNWKECPAKFRDHENSAFHKECDFKKSYKSVATISSQLSTQKIAEQEEHRQCLLMQMHAMRFLARQGFPDRGIEFGNSNLCMLLELLSLNCPSLKKWIRDGKYCSPIIINEILYEMYRESLQVLILKIKSAKIYSIVIDETRDVSGKEQLSLNIRWVDENFEIHDDFIGMYDCAETDAETLIKIIKDIIIRCGLEMIHVRGQTYDGAQNLQGSKSGVTTRLKR